MRILIVSAFPPEPAPEANHALHIAEHLADAGHSVDVLCKQGSIAGSKPGIVVHSVMRSWSWSDLPRLVKALRKSQPEAVLLLYIGWVYKHKSMITFLPTLCRAILPGVPCVTQFENVDELRPRHSLLARMLRRTAATIAGLRGVHILLGTLLRDSARIVALSSPHRDRLVRQRRDVANKTEIIPPSPLIRFCSEDPAAARHHAREAIGATMDDFVLVYWGFIYPGKGLETLLRAFRAAHTRNRHLRLLIVGGSLDFPTEPISCSDYFKFVCSLPEKLGIDRLVRWTGHFDWDSEDGSRYLYAADACVLPFDYGVTLNNSSLAAATTHGLPIIATELPTGRDEGLEHGRNIYLCKPRDVQGLAEAIELVSTDRALRGRLRAGAELLAREWHSWDATTQHLVDVLQSAAGAKETYPTSTPIDLTTVATELFEGRSLTAAPPTTGIRPLVSIVVAAYNVEKYLSQCLDALLNQTLDNVEIIVVNDASTDATSQLLSSYQSRYAQLRVFACQRNVGLASVRNIGLRAARGHYVGFADGDDWVDTRMCEIMYGRASTDDAEVLIADTYVLYEDSKVFGRFFDYRLRQGLDPEIRTAPFELSQDRHVLLLEPVAWTKLYKHSFLMEHALRFEDGMNSYEDMCFHFSVLLKARRISLIDDTLMYYRQNRPGQISGRTSRKVFEVFDVFDRIHRNLENWESPPDIWALFLKVQIRQFDWLWRDRVQVRDKHEFFDLVTRQVRRVPESGYRNFARWSDAVEAAKLFCMRNGWRWAYEQVTWRKWPCFPLLYLRAHGHPLQVIRQGMQRYIGWLRWRLKVPLRNFSNKLLDVEGVKGKLHAIENSVLQLGAAGWVHNARSEEPLVEAKEIDGLQLFFASWPNVAGVGQAIWRVESDHYFTRMAAFRAGDVAVDVGAHVGVLSIYLAKKYPYITVFAVEPDPINFACLLRNIQLNAVTNVIAVNKAVAADGRTQLYCSPWDSGWTTLNAAIALPNRFLRTEQIECITLERLFETNHIAHCRLLKITALGATRELLQAFVKSGCVDLLCGEFDSRDCSQAQVEALSWRIARQHFWRSVVHDSNGVAHGILQRLPMGVERGADLPLEPEAASKPSQREAIALN